MTDTPDFAQWIRAFQAGHSESFEKIYELCFPWVVHFFLNRGFPRAVAEELAQDSLFRVYTHLEDFRSEASFETWLFQIVASVWKNALRGRQTLKRRAERVSLDEMMNADAEERSGPFREPADATANPLDQVLGDERSRLLTAALEGLPEKMRECVLLRLSQDLKYREIAAVLRVSMATVKTQLSAAYQRLKPLLEEHFGGFEL